MLNSARFRILGILILIQAILGYGAVSAQTLPPDLALPLQDKSVRFAVIGDNGTGGKEEYQVAAMMRRYHEKFPFTFVLMLGDNIYGGHSPSDLKRKFEDPYKPLLDAGVKFHASLGNHDDTATETLYKPFNMNGKRYYNFHEGNVQFFALDSNYMDPPQLEWLDKQIPDSDSEWKICFFHHPLYDHSKRHGPALDLRARLEPVFTKHGVNAALAGHEHVYERIKPQKGIYYFVLGSSGQLRDHNLAPSADTAKGFDTDRAFMLVEISGDRMYFQTISRRGETVDSGVLEKQKKPVGMKAAVP